MSEVLSVSILDVVGVKALDVLPCVACLAVYRVPIIVSEAAYAFDGVRFFLDRLDLTRQMAQ